jgi:phage gp16-like protein
MSTAPADPRLRTARTLVQIGRNSLQLDDDTYRALLARLCNGKTSSTALHLYECEKVIEHMKACGFVIKSNKPAPSARTRPADQVSLGAREAQMEKLRALWSELEHVGAVRKRESAQEVDAAIEGWAKKRMNLAALRFASAQEMSRLIEQMKRWVIRLGGNIVA